MLRLTSILISFFLATFAAANIDCVTTDTSVQKSQTLKTPILNSERIKEKFGSYGVQVIESDSPLIRISKLYSVHDDKQIGRTIAITRFTDPMDASLVKGHRLITEKNESIGSTFKNLGWSLTKRNLYFGVKVFDSSCLYQLMNDNPQPLAVHIYELLLSKGDQKNISYAIIAELQHADYLTLSDLKSIYGEVSTVVDLNEVWQSVTAAVNKLEC